MSQEWFSDLYLLGFLCPPGPRTGLARVGCTLAEFQGLVLAGVGALVLLIAARHVYLRRVGSRGSGEGSSMLVFPLDGQSSGTRAHRMEPQVDPPPSPAPRTPAEPGPNHRRAHHPPAAPPHRPEPTQAGYQAPLDGTLQLLPGRLEVVGGSANMEEIRFVRVPGSEPEITFGRNDGVPHRHIQLASPTVSRVHARFRYAEGRWFLHNESTTNPTVLNGEPLPAGVEAAPLHDGDRIEMGEVSFVFHQPEIADRLPLRSSWYTDQGRRPTNQDAVVVRTLPKGRELLAVCDGMGSHAMGRMASQIAMETLVQSLEEDRTLKEAVIDANRAVLEEADEDPDRAGMGTTVVALLREGGRYRIANVGDSRAYRVDAEGIRLLTEDHSFMTEALKEGRMSEEEAARSPWKNAITRHLGASSEVEVDLFGDFQADDPHLVLLCSDGLHAVLGDEEIESIVRGTPGVRKIARELGEEVLRRGADDNVTVAVLEFAHGLAMLQSESG